MNFTDWLAEQAACRTDDIADFGQGVACHALWPTQGRSLETFEDFVVREFGTAAVKTLHRAWSEFTKSKAPKQANPFGRSVDTSAAKARRKVKASVGTGGEVQNVGNLWAGHPVLDRARLPLKPPGR